MMEQLQRLPVTLLLGRVFLITGMTGTVVLSVIYFLLPVQYKLIVLSGSVFPVFWVLGVALYVIGRQRLQKQGWIVANGSVQPAMVTEILPIGRRPVRKGSVYGAIVKVSPASGSPQLSRLYFYGEEYALIEDALTHQTVIEVIYAPAAPGEVLLHHGK